MRSPKTFAEFKTLIHEMAHRERFVFEVENPSDEEGTEIEIYTTVRRDNKDREPQANLYYQWRDSLGEYREGMNKGNKRLTLVTDSYLETIYSWIKK
jgi:hypothetical protein